VFNDRFFGLRGRNLGQLERLVQELSGFTRLDDLVRQGLIQTLSDLIRSDTISVGQLENTVSDLGVRLAHLAADGLNFRYLQA
jgi:hypothetical protein